MLFYWWYFRKRGPASGASESELRKHKIKAVAFSVLVFVVALVVGAYGAQSNNKGGNSWAKGDCVNSAGFVVSCSGGHFARVLEVVPNRTLCPGNTTNYLTETSRDASPGSIVCIDTTQ